VTTGVGCQDEAGSTPLHTAIHVSCHEAIERITSQRDVDYHVVNNDDLNVLHLAVVKGDIRQVGLSSCAGGVAGSSKRSD